MKDFNATYETSHIQHSNAINEAWSAYMAWYLVIMLDDAHDQVLVAF
jgi:hypothetical protein